jgi:hypothetical protein
MITRLERRIESLRSWLISIRDFSEESAVAARRMARLALEQDDREAAR